MQTIYLRLNIPGEPPSIVSLDGLDSEDFAGIDEGRLEPKMFTHLIEALKSQSVKDGFISLIPKKKMSYSVLTKLKVIEIKGVYSVVPMQHKTTGQTGMFPVPISGLCFNLVSLAGINPITESNPVFGEAVEYLRQKETGLITPGTHPVINITDRKK